MHQLHGGGGGGLPGRRRGRVLDVDQNGEVAALTDGLLLMRWGFGFRGQSLVDGAVDMAKCQRCSSGEIEAYLDGLDGG